MWELRTANIRTQNGGRPVIQRFFKTVTCLIAFSVAALVDSRTAVADNPSPTASTLTPKLPPGLAKLTGEITDVVMEHHLDPPARQQMILGGVKALFRAADMPVPSGLSRRVSSLTTPEQLAALLADVWPKPTKKPIAVDQLEEALFQGLLSSVSGDPQLLTEKERKVSEQFEGNRYVGIHIALGMNDQEKRPAIFETFEGGPADRAGVKKDDLIEQIDGVDTKGMVVMAAVDRLRGPEGTNVTIQVRQPKAANSRTYTIRRGQHPRSSVQGVRKRTSGGWDIRLEGPDAIGYLKISEMLGSTPHELRKMASQLESEGDRALVLDLRGLRSDSVHTAILLADSLLESGPIGRVKTARGETTYQADSDAILRGWPLAVLVDVDTSGAAEWLAAALQDNHRAVIVGSPTMSAKINPGPGFVKSTIPVGDGQLSVSLATGLLERGDGRAISLFDRSLPSLIRSRDEALRAGVHPDHLIADTPSDRLVPGSPRLRQNSTSKPAGEPSAGPDHALQKAVELIRVSLKKA
jgi:carboxyl-terminal processing protease